MTRRYTPRRRIETEEPDAEDRHNLQRRLRRLTVPALPGELAEVVSQLIKRERARLEGEGLELPEIVSALEHFNRDLRTRPDWPQIAAEANERVLPDGRRYRTLDGAIRTR